MRWSVLMIMGGLNCKSAKNNSGFLMLELMVAIIVIACGIYAFAQAIGLSLRAYRYADNYLQGLFILENSLADIELSRQVAPSMESILNQVNYRVEHTLNPGSDHRISDIKTAVFWQERGRVKKIELGAKLLIKQ